MECTKGESQTKRRSYRSRFAKSARGFLQDVTPLEMLLALCISFAITWTLSGRPSCEAEAVRANMEADDMCHATFGLACRPALPPRAVAALYQQMRQGNAVGLQIDQSPLGVNQATPWLLSHARTLITMSTGSIDSRQASSSLQSDWQDVPELTSRWMPVGLQSSAQPPRDIAGIMALYRQPLDFIIVPASAISPPEDQVLPALLLLLKSHGATLVVTGVERGLEDTVLSALPGCWKSAVIGRSGTDGTVTIGSMTAESPVLRLMNLPGRLADAAWTVEGRVAAAFRRLREAAGTALGVSDQ